MAKTTKITFYASIALFIVYAILFGLSFLDIYNIIDYNQYYIFEFDYTIELLLVFGIPLVFFVGVLLSLITLLTANETFPYLQTIKIVSYMYVLLPTIWFLGLLLIIFSNFAANFEMFVLLFLLFAVFLFAVFFLFVYLFDISWSKSKRIWFAIGEICFGLIASVIMFFIIGFGMMDGSLS